MRWLAVLALIAAPLASPGLLPAGSEPRVFGPSEPLQLTLEGPLDDLFAHSKSDDDYSVDAHLRLTDSAAETGFKVSVSTRGHTSRRASECEFPKLKFTFSSDVPVDSIFAGVKAIKIGTHCGDRPDTALTPRYGRLANEKEPLREAVAYRVLQALDVPTLRARPARIAYVFTDGQQQRLVRNAMLLEDDDEVTRRYGAVAQISEDEFGDASSGMAGSDVAALAFAEALLGNFDWCLRFTPDDRYRCDARHPLWNILGLVRPGQPALPVAYDFDLSGFVVPRHVWFSQVFSEEFVPSKSPVEVEVLSQLQRTRSLFTRAELDAARAAFAARKDAAYQAVGASVVDEDGRRMARDYLDRFFAVIEDESSFYRPVVATPNTAAYLDPRGTRPACGESSTIPIGTPVTEPLDTESGMVKVRLLDVMWQWAPPARCDAVHRDPVWVASSAIEANYPR